jgi:N-acetylglucosamine-6-phosphate deacetylase
MKAIVNAQVHTPTERIAPAVVVIEGTRIHSVGTVELPPGAEVIDAGGRAIVPGFIDQHFHGAGGHTLTTVDTIAEELTAMAKVLPRFGTTSFLICPSMGDQATLQRILAAIADTIDAGLSGAQCLGIHLEGPYLDPARHGAFPPDALRQPSLAETKEYLEAARGHLRIVTIAPNLPHAIEVADFLRQQGVVASVGHTSAGYDEAKAALAGPFASVTHLFNAMTGLGHREPGVVGAAYESERTMVELISDGVHVHPAMVRLTLRVCGTDRVVLITDAMAGAGLGDGVYTLLGQEVTVRGGKATLADGTIAGSVLTLDRAVANAQAFAGLSLGEAAKMATMNPARVLGLADHKAPAPNAVKGRLAPGFDADLVILDDDGRVWLTMILGEVAYRAG